MRSRVEIFEQIRRGRAREGLSIHELADRHHVHRRTVRQALSSALPPPRKSYPARARPAIEPWTQIIDRWLEDDKLAPRKQRPSRAGSDGQDIGGGGHGDQRAGHPRHTAGYPRFVGPCRRLCRISK